MLRLPHHYVLFYGQDNSEGPVMPLGFQKDFFKTCLWGAIGRAVPCVSFFHRIRVGPEQVNVGVAIQSHWQSTANMQACSYCSKNTPQLLLHVSERSIRPFGGGKHSYPTAGSLLWLLVVALIWYGHTSLRAGNRWERSKQAGWGGQPSSGDLQVPAPPQALLWLPQGRGCLFSPSWVTQAPSLRQVVCCIAWKPSSPLCFAASQRGSRHGLELAGIFNHKLRLRNTHLCPWTYHSEAVKISFKQPKAAFTSSCLSLHSQMP